MTRNTLVLAMGVVLFLVVFTPAHALRGWFEEGLFLLRSGRNQEAVEAFSKALAINPKLARAFNNRGIALKHMGRLEEALDDFGRALRVNPELVDAYNNRASVYIRLRLWEEAVADCLVAQSLDPSSLLANNQLAWLFATCPDPQWRDGPRAVKLAEKTRRIHISPQVLDTLAAAHAESGSFTRAVSTQQEAIKLMMVESPENQGIYEERLLSYQAGRPWRIRAKQKGSGQAEPEPGYCVHVGTLKSLTQANMALERLRSAGHPVRLFTITDDAGQPLHLLRLDCFSSQKLAAEAAKAFMAKEKMPASITSEEVYTP